MPDGRMSGVVNDSQYLDHILDDGVVNAVGKSTERDSPEIEVDQRISLRILLDAREYGFDFAEDRSCNPC
jgi:hypothetical protein